MCLYVCLFGISSITAELISTNSTNKTFYGASDCPQEEKMSVPAKKKRKKVNFRSDQKFDRLDQELIVHNCSMTV